MFTIELQSYITGATSPPRTSAAASSLRWLSGAARRVLLPACLLSIALAVPINAQRRAAQPLRPKPDSRVNVAKTIGAKETTAVSQQEFDRLAAEAVRAREAGELDRATQLYRKAIAMRPSWGEGWWSLGTLLYDKDVYAEAARAFERAARAEPKAGAAWAMLGLCEYQLDRPDDALAHIRQAFGLGVGGNPELTRVLRFHEATLLTLKGDFELAQNALSALSFEGVKSDSLTLAHGLAALRIPMLPKDVPAAHPDREIIRGVGRTAHLAIDKRFADAEKEFDRLLVERPKLPNLHYAYGRFLLLINEDKRAIAAFKRELENSPSHMFARLQIAYISLKNKNAEEGIEYAEEAVRIDPRLGLARYIYGRLLYDANQNARAVEELEAARTLASEEPQIYYALSRAYARAARKQDAEHARETFTRLSERTSVKTNAATRAAAGTSGGTTIEGSAATGDN